MKNSMNYGLVLYKRIHKSFLQAFEAVTTQYYSTLKTLYSTMGVPNLILYIFLATKFCMELHFL